jgi:hypothetical protein
MMNGYIAGRADALQSLGLVKVAKPWQRLKDWAWKKIPTWHTVKREMIGQPSEFADEIAMGRALDRKSLIRESFKAPNALSKAMFYGLPAVETISVLADEKDHKAKRIGGVLGSAALGLGAYRPLGMVGSMALDPVGRAIGEAVGQTAGYVGTKAIDAAKNHLGQNQ